jgi:hypothetical protein
MQLVCSLETLKDKRKNTNFGLGLEPRCEHTDPLSKKS